jgi:hypothetical protein
METTMNTRQFGILGLAALGLALAAPVQAAQDFMGGAFVAASQDDEVRRDPRDSRRDEQSEEDKRRPSRRAAKRDEPHGYGYGYERRHQKRFEDDDDRSRGRR